MSHDQLVVVGLCQVVISAIPHECSLNLIVIKQKNIPLSVSALCGALHYVIRTLYYVRARQVLCIKYNELMNNCVLLNLSTSVNVDGLS